jgi:tetratricopeptide (TPR) repeat protein
MSRQLVILLLTGFVVAAGCFPVSALAQPAGESVEVAGDLYARGVEAFQAGDFEMAAMLFEGAWRYDSSAVLAWNAGRAWDRAGDADAAILWYTRAAQVGDAAINARVAEALAEISARTTAPDHDREGPRSRVVAGGVLVGVGAIGAGLGTVWALRAHDRHDAARRALDVTTFDVNVREGRSARTASNLSWTAGLIAAGVGTTLLVIRDGEGRQVAVRGGPRTATLEVRF